MNIEYFSPEEIEKRSFEIISDNLTDKFIDKRYEKVIKRVIHTTADFDYADNLIFSEDAVNKGINAVKNGAHIITDTKMVMAGINKTKFEKYKGQIHCFISDDDVCSEAKKREITRSAVSIEKALKIDKPLIFAIGNAPTALIRLGELIKENKIKPQLVIGVPVGFVNVVESKEFIINTSCDYIVARGQKGGSNVAAAICNAIIYSCEKV